MSTQRKLLIGIDFGTDSVRSLLVNSETGEELAATVAYYQRWKMGLFCDPKQNRFRQHPQDYLDAMTQSITELLAMVPGSSADVQAIGVDTTGSTPALADSNGTPLAMNPRFEHEPDAMFILWKDHSSIEEAALINQTARTWGGQDFTKFAGGVYSSEWFWAKILHVLRTNPHIAANATTIIEHCDWIPAELTGVKNYKDIARSRCAAGHKALWHPTFSPYPSPDFLTLLHPSLVNLAASLGTETKCSDQSAGKLSAAWATKLGLHTGVTIAVGAFDAHMGAVGGGVREGTFLRIMGTSTCDIMIGPRPENPKNETLIAGICGQVDGSVIPGFIGYEAGQSAYGDIFAWFRRLLAWPLNQLIANGTINETQAEHIDKQLLPMLDAGAQKIPAGSSEVLALDWLNGRRTPDADQSLTGAITGLSLGTDAPAMYRALVESAAYGARAIVERFRSQGIKVERVAAIGGVAKKSDFVMQTLSNVLDMSIEVAASEQPCALGASIFGAVAAGIYPDVLSAQKKLASPSQKTYKPDSAQVNIYNQLYKNYLNLGSFVEQETKKQ